MAKITSPADVKMVAAITCSTDWLRAEVTARLETFLGPVDHKSKVFPFLQTDYYESEMGKNLSKGFLSFETLVSPDFLPKCKIRTNMLEKEHLSGSCRTVNVDPGYLADAKLLIATAKNFSHRVYIGRGIFGDLQMTFQTDSFKPMPWCFADYKQDFVIQFFNAVRNTYFRQVRELRLEVSKTRKVT